MNNIQIYSAEKRDGLEASIANNKISFASSITKLKVEPDASNIFHAIAQANPDQPDLIHRYSILASVGWNNNDDVFMREELFNARSTPVDKQVNFMHDELTIIGHMTEAFVMDQQGSLIKTEAFNELPENFDIGVGFVLYKMWEDKTRAELVSKVIAEIDSGNWFVSMECMFPAFDYAIIDAKGNHKIVARNEQSSFLSKYLRSYGGPGVYKDAQGEYKVGRLLRGLFFSGKGIVDNPANKRSVILNTNFSSKASNLNLREVKMDELDKIKAELAKSQAENVKLTTELSQKAQAAVSQEIDKVKAEKADAVKALEVSIAEVTKLKTELTTANDNVTKAIAEAKASKDEADKMGKECATLKAEAVKAVRIGQLVKAGLNEAKAAEVYAKWSTVADDQFADIVALHTKAMDDDDLATAKNKTVAKADLDKAETEKTKAGNTKSDTTDTGKAEAFTKLSKSLARFMPGASSAQKLTETK